VTAYEIGFHRINRMERLCAATRSNTVVTFDVTASQAELQGSANTEEVQIGKVNRGTAILDVALGPVKCDR